MSKIKASLILAHGAGADSSSEFMQYMVQAISCDQIDVLTFDFPYMIRRQQTGKKSPPDRMPKLAESFKAQIAQVASDNIFIGGKSMGGRVASMIADEVKATGLLCFGYPFHPPAKPEKTRTEHLESLKTPGLFLQGTRDPFGKPDEVASYRLSPAINIRWLNDGNHSLETLKRSEKSTEETWLEAATLAHEFILDNS